MPAAYALYNYGKTFDPFGLEKYSIQGFREVSSTYREESVSERYTKLHQGTPAQKDVYFKMTQLGFDSGKMPLSEYKQLMGQNYCSQANCCDKKCTLYKLNCVGWC